MKKMGTYLFWVLAIVLTGSAFVYYPALENAIANLFAKDVRPIENNSEKDSAKTMEEHPEESIVKLTDEQTNKIGLEIQTAAPGKMTLTLSSRGKIIIDPDRLAHVIPKVPGIAKEARKNIGSNVSAGEIIAILESQEMAHLKAGYVSAAGKEKLATATFEREKSLYEKGISSAQDYLNSKNSWEETRINQQLASQKLRAFGLSNEAISHLQKEEDPDLRDYEIYAPIDGTVLMRHLTKGEYVDQNTTIYEIADLSTVLVETGIYPKDLSRVRVGQQVEVINPENLASTKATLTYLSPTIAGESIAAKAIALLENTKGEWRPGLFVNVNIATDEITAPLVINKDAIQNMDGCDCAFVLTEKGFEKRVLKLGRSDHLTIEVLSGLMPGERYVSKNPFLLKAEMNKESAKDDD